MYRIMKSLFKFITVFINIEIGLSSICLWNSYCLYRCFSSRTPYNYFRGDIRDSVVHLKALRLILSTITVLVLLCRSQSCEPISIWGIVRHGKRNPGPAYANSIKHILRVKGDIVANFAASKSSICAQDIDNLLNWSTDGNMFEYPNELTNEGEYDMEGIGKRLKKVYPKLFEGLTKDNYVIQSANGSLMENSAKAFIKGLDLPHLTYERNGPFNIAPHESCENYQKNIRNNQKTLEVSDKYTSNPEYLVMRDRIQKRAGFSFNLTDNNIMAFYDLCRYNSSGLDNRLSPWCALFIKEDLEVLNYFGDLRNYYKNGPGFWMSKIFGAYPLTDMLNTFKEAKKGRGNKLTVHICHGATMDMLYSALGWFEDEPLTAKKRNPDRKWQNCKFSSFSSNLFSVLHRCTGYDTMEYKVVFYVNEAPMPACKGGMCSWEEFEQKLTFTNMSLKFCSSLRG